MNRTTIVQVFGNVATVPEKMTSKLGRTYWQWRLAESHRGLDGEQPTWYSVRLSKAEDPRLAKGDFVKVTGRLKTDFWLSREGKPTGGLLIIAFEASKIAKPTAIAVPAEKLEIAKPVPAAAQAMANMIEWQD